MRLYPVTIMAGRLIRDYHRDMILTLQLQWPDLEQEQWRIRKRFVTPASQVFYRIQSDHPVFRIIKAAVNVTASYHQHMIWWHHETSSNR